MLPGKGVDSSNLKSMGHGGFRPGAGRKSLKTRVEVMEQLQKMLPQAVAMINANLEAKTKGKKMATYDAWKLVDKFAPELKATELSGTDGEPLEIKIVRAEIASNTTDPELP
jgi:hypothetical protein